MRLFYLIVEATLKNNSNAIWEILQMFDPLITAHCKNIYTKKVDEDLKSEMYLILYDRIKKFNIFDN